MCQLLLRGENHEKVDTPDLSARKITQNNFVVKVRSNLLRYLIHTALLLGPFFLYKKQKN